MMYYLIPQPLRVKEREGWVPFSAKTKFTGAFSELYAVLTPMLPQAEQGENRLLFVEDGTVPPEGYRVTCTDGNITVTASDSSGAFYGVMSLLQLAKDGKVPTVEIEDAPRYRYRGFMLDCARHFWSVDKIKQILDVMARLKMNVFHWHLTDDQGWRIEIKKYPLLTQKGAIRKSTALAYNNADGSDVPHDETEYGRGLFYTQDQAREVVEYARQRRIQVLPEIDMPGHFVAAIACYPELSCTGEETEVAQCWGVMENVACCGKETVYRFVKDILDELCQIFPYPYFHIGGDEVPKSHWKACPHCQNKIRQLGLKDENALQGYFNNVISDYLMGKGKQTVGWNEILEGDNLHPGFIVQWWRLIDDSSREMEWLEQGNKLILSLGTYVYMNLGYPLDRAYGFGPAVYGIADDTNVWGVEAPLWTELVRDTEKLDRQIYPWLHSIAEVGWTVEANKDYGGFETRIEALRSYFAALGAPIVPQEVYRVGAYL